MWWFHIAEVFLLFRNRKIHCGNPASGQRIKGFLRSGFTEPCPANRNGLYPVLFKWFGLTNSNRATVLFCILFSRSRRSRQCLYVCFNRKIEFTNTFYCNRSYFSAGCNVIFTGHAQVAEKIRIYPSVVYFYAFFSSRCVLYIFHRYSVYMFTH